MVSTQLVLVVLAIEVGAPVAFAHPRLSRLWALGAFGMHWGILAIMGIRFRYQLSGLAFAPFFELERIAERIARPPARRQRLLRLLGGRIG